MLTPDQLTRQRRLFEHAFPVAKDSPLLEGTDAYECGDVDMRWRAWVACYVANGCADTPTSQPVPHIPTMEELLERFSGNPLAYGEYRNLTHGTPAHDGMPKKAHTFELPRRWNTCPKCNLPLSAVRPDGSVARTITCRCTEQGHP